MLTKEQIKKWREFITDRVQDETGATMSVEEIENLRNRIQTRINNGLFIQKLMEKIKNEEKGEKTLSRENSNSSAG